jgi:protein-tyrosine phosphatase
MALDCDEVIPDRLWVGVFVRPEDAAELVGMRVTTVVSLQSDEDYAYYGLSARKLTSAFAASGIEFQRIPVEDFNPERLAGRMPECVAGLTASLAREGARVYLHCTAGINRAPTVAAGYLVSEQGMPARAAYEHVRERRACSPYLRVLERFEEYLRSRKSDAERGTDRPEAGV